MADEKVAPEVAVEPVVEAPVVKAPVEAVAEETPAVEIVAEEAPASEEAKPAEEAPAEAAPAEEAKPADAEKPAEEVKAEAPVYTDLNLPEGFKADPEQIKALSDVLAATGLPQERGQEVGQQLLDMHAAAMKSYADNLAQSQQDVFAETRRSWVADFDKQAGNRRNTLLKDAQFALSEVTKDAKELQALQEVLSFTGAGDHPAVVNAFAKLGKRLREGKAPPQGLAMDASKGGNPADRRYGAQRR